MKKLHLCYYWACLGLCMGPNIRADPLQNKVITDYYTAFLNITYFDGDRGVFHTERTETGRFSTNIPKDFSGQVVIMANKRDTNESEAIYTGCQGPFEPNWPSSQPWIALVQRGDCTFNQKIQNALDLKASGILIYDLPDGGGVLQSMKVEASPMPSVFTYHWKGMEIAKLVQEHQRVTLAVKKGSHCTSAAKGANPKNPSQVIYCTPEDTWEQFQNLLTKQSPFWNWNVTAIKGAYDFNEKRTSVLFVSVSFIILMLISLAWLLFYYVQRFRYIHAKDRLERRLCGQAKRALAIIPIITLTKDEDDEDSDTCPVCIEEYKIGETVRILPCNHRFHKACIDQWLLDKRTCPMCKMDILKYYGLIGDSEMMNFEEREESLLNLT
eukprot:01479.XXX_2201_3897_1 [CDS] Oithona nana genome sequencing.